MGKPVGKCRRNVERGTSALYEGRFGERHLCQAFRLLGQGAEHLSELTTLQIRAIYLILMIAFRTHRDRTAPVHRFSRLDLIFTRQDTLDASYFG